MSENKIKNLINSAELAKVLGLSRGTIYRKADAGKIPHYKLDSNRMFDLDEVMEYLKLL